MTYSEELIWWIISISTSAMLTIVGIIISWQLYKRNSLRYWTKKLSKRLRYIQKYYPESMDKRWTTYKDSTTGKESTNEWNGFELDTHAYWGYHREGSAYSYSFIVPFIDLNMSKENYGLYVWITYDPNGKNDDGSISMENSDLQELEFIGKGGQDITKEILGSVERVKVIYNWYVNFYKLAKLKKKTKRSKRKFK